MDSSRTGDLLSQINAAVDRMRQFTPDEPYILSIPQEEPRFHHHSRLSADAWLHNTPFSHNENPNQQYQTFFYHEPLSDVFHLHRHSHYATHHLRQQPPSAAPSSRSTPTTHPKKKISLAAYTNKQSVPRSEQRTDDNDNDINMKSPPVKKKKLPRMLSPLHLPPIPPHPLSPTLPASIVASLDAHPYRSGRRSRSKHTSKCPPSPDPPPPRRPVKEERQDKSGPVVKPERQNKPDPVVKPERQDKSDPVVKPERPSEDRDKPNQDSGLSHDSLIVKFRIPKTMRKNLSRYLQTKPNPITKNMEPEKSQRDSTGTKRPRASDDDHPPDPKRRKEPSTPAPPSFHSPASTHKPQHETPTARKGTQRTTTAMKRVESTDGITNDTPPPSARQPNGTTKPSPSAPKSAEVRAWDLEQVRLGKLGRELKHSASALASSSSTQPDPDPEKAAIASLESALFFILSFYCSERSVSARNPPLAPDPTRTWVTLTGFWKFVKHHCQGFPHLYGLACHLGTVYNAMIMLRLTTAKRHSELSAEETRTLHEAVTTGIWAAKEAAAKLPVSVIVKEFPQTWAKALEGVGEEIVRPGCYEGGFEVPVGLDTDPLHAVRIGHSLLSEWCSKRDNGYKMRFTLSAT